MFNSEVGVRTLRIFRLLIRIFLKVINRRDEFLLRLESFRMPLFLNRKSWIDRLDLSLGQNIIHAFLAYLKFFLLNLVGVLLSLKVSHINDELGEILCLVLLHWWSHDLVSSILRNILISSIFKRAVFSRLNNLMLIVLIITKVGLVLIIWSNLVLLHKLFLKLGMIALNLIRLILVLWSLFN